MKFIYDEKFCITLPGLSSDNFLWNRNTAKVEAMEVSTRKYKVEKFYMEDISQMLPKSQYVEEFEPAQNDPVKGAYSLF